MPLPQQLPARRLRLVLLLAGQQRGWLQQRWRRWWQVQQQFKAALVEGGFVHVVHACPSAVTHPNPPNR